MIRPRGIQDKAAKGIVSLSLLGIAALGAASCGSSSSGTIAASFRDKANAVCAEAVAEHAQHPFPLASFDPLHPAPSQLPTVADYFSHYGDGSQIDDRLIALGEPIQGLREWVRLMTLVGEANANGWQQITAAHDKDVPRFVRLVRSARQIHNQIQKAALEAGFATSSPCASVF